MASNHIGQSDNIPVTPKEIMATVIARDLADTEWVEVGANLPVPRAGALLAHLTHCPNMRLMIAMTKVCLVDEPVIEDFEYITDARATRWAEAYYPHDRLLSEMKLRMRCGVFFCGGMQVDRYGNSNLIGIKDDHGRLKVRGPGGIGTCNATAYNSRYHLVVMRHSNQILVEKCDFISALGYGDGSPKLRQRLGLPGAGPRYIITPLCVFEFDEIERSAVIRSLHPGVSIEEVVEKTGFDFEVPVNIPETELPTEEELFILRNRIDPKGSLRT